MQIAAVYSDPANQHWLRIKVPEESTVEQATACAPPDSLRSSGLRGSAGFAT